MRRGPAQARTQSIQGPAPAHTLLYRSLVQATYSVPSESEGRLLNCAVRSTGYLPLSLSLSGVLVSHTDEGCQLVIQPVICATVLDTNRTVSYRHNFVYTSLPADSRYILYSYAGSEYILQEGFRFKNLILLRHVIELPEVSKEFCHRIRKSQVQSLLKSSRL